VPRPALLALLAVALIASGCDAGPLDATQSGGTRAEPVALLSVLPSPGSLRGRPAEAADALALQRAFTGDTDHALARRIDERTPAAAGVRSWRGPRGGTLTAAVSVWDSHLVATGIGAGIASRLVDDGGIAWTPDAVRGSRGARIDADDRRELRLAYSVGPNSLYVRSTGPVPEETVTTALNRLIQGLRGQGG
jgi:hypothetical protein